MGGESFSLEALHIQLFPTAPLDRKGLGEILSLYQSMKEMWASNIND